MRIVFPRWIASLRRAKGQRPPIAGAVYFRNVFTLGQQPHKSQWGRRKKVERTKERRKAAGNWNISKEIRELPHFEKYHSYNFGLKLVDIR